MENITPADLAALGAEATLIDVRERNEFADVRVPWSVNIPLSELVERLGEVPADGPVYIMCHAGGRSARACDYLEREGKPVVNVLGGISEWDVAGLPVDRGE